MHWHPKLTISSPTRSASPARTCCGLSGADEHAIDQLRAVQLTQARPAIEHLARALPAHRAPEVIIEPGRAEQVIPDLADRHHVDLVVVGTQQISGIRHALLGNIARHTIRHAPGDILIVHTR